jgi:starch synthase
MNILFPVAECVPFAKTGGLADVAGALPQALARLGHDVRVVMPLYAHVRKSGVSLHKTKHSVLIPIGNDHVKSEVWETKSTEKEPKIYFLHEDAFFDRPELYRSPSGGYPDNDRRFLFLCRGALELGKHLGIPLDVVHCHDWHTGLIPAYLKTLYAQESVYKKTRSVFTIHNLAYQGHFPKETFALTELPDSIFTHKGVEFYGGINFMKAGLVYSDWVTTVSPTYAKEIQSKEYGYGMEGVLQARKAELTGILNGLDYSVWDPEQDSHTNHSYSAAQPEDKAKVRETLLAKIGLHAIEKAPIVGMITRLDDQKGCNIIAEVIDKLMEQNLQLVILGTGDKKYHELFLRLKAKYPRRLSLHLEFNEALAHLIYAGADMFLMPSKYEPCGLGQLIGMRYGTIPIVRQIGGLADTVVDYGKGKGTGFAFKEYTGLALLKAIKRACEVFVDKKAWKQLLQNAMTQDFSWDHSAREYERLFKKIIE